MADLITFCLENPVLVGLIFGGLESLIMPIVPVKWNGVFYYVFTKLKGGQKK